MSEGSFYGTDRREKQGSQLLCERPALESDINPAVQARMLANFFAREDDLTFKEGSVKDVSDRGRARVVTALIEALASSLKRAPAKKAATKSAPAVAVAPSWVYQDVLEQMEALRRIRARGNPSECLSAAEPLRRLATLPIDSLVLKKTKVALELNQDYWKKAPRQEVRQMVIVLVRQWKAMFRNEQGTAVVPGPSERSLRNLATDLEESAYGRAPKAADYQRLVQDLLTRLEQAPDTATSLFEGAMRSMDLIQRLHKRDTASASTMAAAAKRTRTM